MKLIEQIQIFLDIFYNQQKFKYKRSSNHLLLILSIFRYYLNAASKEHCIHLILSSLLYAPMLLVSNYLRFLVLALSLFTGMINIVKKMNILNCN